MATEKDLKPGMLVGWTHRNDFVLGTIVETKRVNCIVRRMSDPTGSKLHKIEKLILESEIGKNDIQMAKAQGGRSACWEEGRREKEGRCAKPWSPLTAPPPTHCPRSAAR